MRRHDSTSSDGHLAHVFRHAAKELFNEDVGEVTYRTLRCVGTLSPVCMCGQLRVRVRACVRAEGRAVLLRVHVS